MRIFRFWTQVEKTIDVGGKAQKVRGHGGSNLSLDDARKDAEQRLAKVLSRIAGADLRHQDYEADIREEIVAQIDDRNLVTRNRYGAEVLNSADLMFIDIDEPKYRFWEIIFGFRNPAHKQERIVEFVKERAATPEWRSLGLRLYQTKKGVRVIVTGQKFDPKSEAASKLMRSLNADRLYTLLCRKQGCFRARLTPKPYRIKCRTHRVIYPRNDAAAESALKEWLAEYERHRKGFGTCKFLCALGPDHHNAVVDFHDKATGAFSGLKLA